MSIDESALGHARQAWRRLLGSRRRDAADGEQALQALADLGTVRRLLDQLELTAVRTARASGRSWSEIATHLGVSRQSAWERWRDLDDRTPDTPGVVTVPDVIGLSCDDALRTLRDLGLNPVGHKPGATPEPISPAATGTVVDQVPKSGARRRPGSHITLWLDQGGGSAGVREPRRPKPSPRAARDEVDPATETLAG